MKKLFLIALLFVFACAVNAQQLKATFDPITNNKDDGRGFFVDFSFTIINYDDFGVHLKLNSHDINLVKGYYRKYFSQPKGKLYACPQLKGLCGETKVTGFWVRLSWEYNGKTYENGGRFTGSQKSSGYSFIDVTNDFTPPSEIPVSARKNSVVTKIAITSCAFSTEDKIEDVVRAINGF